MNVRRPSWSVGTVRLDISALYQGADSASQQMFKMTQGMSEEMPCGDEAGVREGASSGSWLGGVIALGPGVEHGLDQGGEGNGEEDAPESPEPAKHQHGYDDGHRM